jgi:hypothetical protein
MHGGNLATKKIREEEEAGERDVCDWCKVEGHDMMHVPLTVDGHDTRLHEIAVETIVKPVVGHFIRTLFQNIHKQSHGSNSAALHKGRLTEEQCRRILIDYPEEVNVTTLEQYRRSSDDKLRGLLERNGIRYDCLLTPESANLSLVERLLDLPNEVGQYSPFVEHTTGFQIVLSRYASLCPSNASRLPDSKTLDLSDLSFLLLCLHVQGLVALTPVYNLNAWASTVRTDTILHLLDKESITENHRRVLQKGILELETVLFSIA